MSYTSIRLSRIPVPFFNELDERVKIIEAQGGDVIRLDIGSPDFTPPDFIIETLRQSVSNPNNHGYGSHKGTGILREAWANYYQKIYDVSINPDAEVLPLIGTKEGIFHLPSAWINTGDIVLIPDPGYVTYSRGTLIADGEPYNLPLLEQNNYLPDLDDVPIEILNKAKILWLNYPNNPTTAIAELDYFKEVICLAEKYNFIVCHDAAYSRVSFDKLATPSILQIKNAKEVAVEFNSLSKSHNMAGWRIGALLGNKNVVNALYKLKTNADSGHFRPIHDATVTALTSDQSWIDDRNKIYRQRRDLVIDKLSELGLGVNISPASIYVWTRVPDGWTSYGFVKQILDDTHVSLTPGTFFGHYGEGYTRISLTVPISRLEEAMSRIGKYLREGKHL